MNKWMRNLLLLTMLFTMLLPYTAKAHDNSVGFSEIEVMTDRVHVTLFLEQIFLLDVAKLPWNGDPFDEAYIEQHGDAMSKSAAPHLYVIADGERLTAVPAGVKLTNRAGIDYVQIDYDYEAAKAITGLEIKNDLYVRDNPHTHTNFATIKVGDRQTEFIFEEEKRTYKIDNVADAFSTWFVVKQFFLLGVKHILEGYDHLLFLLSLLLVVRGWRDIVKIVTTFTVAHTITLILASLQVVSLPSLLVEVAIALSICYVAAENLFKKEFKKRWLVTFVLGLIHGFGFAGVLAELSMPKSHLLTGLLTFNLGVEAGQLAVVLVVMPLLLLVRKASWHKRFVQAGSVAIFLFGLFWVVQRLFNV